MLPALLLALAVVQVAPTTAPPLETQPPETQAPETEISHPLRERTLGIHVGINATVAFDARMGRFFYAEAATQVTGVGALVDSHNNWVASLMLLAGVSVPLLERANVRLTFDAGVNGVFLHAQPVNDLGVGILAGLRLVHRSGFTFAFKAPLIGYVGSVQVQRGGITYYYIAALVTVPLITLGYSF